MKNLKTEQILTIVLIIISAIYLTINKQTKTDYDRVVHTAKKTSDNLHIGYEILTGGEKVPLNSGDLSTIQVWEEYIDAHNNKDLEAIKNLNHDDVKVLGPNGEVINGSNEHIEFLNNWFNENNPSWSTFYMISNELIENDTLKQYVTSCHQMTLMIDSNQIKVSQIHDAWIVDGKVKKFYVYERKNISTTP